MDNRIIDFTKDGECIRCGNCCNNYLPISSKDIKQIQRYVKKYKITEQKHLPPSSSLVIDITCPFLEENNGHSKCLIYSVRPEICRSFICNDPIAAINNKKLFHKKYKVIDMRVKFF